MSHKTFFGFKEIDKTEKENMVKGVFSSVASKYDIMNDVMSMGIHRLWKDELINQIQPQNNTHLLDVAAGTGDIAFRFLKKAPNSKATICDINYNMLHEGVDNSINNNILQGLDWACTNAEALSFKDNTFDYYTIAFGIRNVTNIGNTLSEAYRVLKPGGKFCCLEFSHVQNPAFAKIYDIYSFKLIPKFGQLIAGDESSYRYLVESIRKFPKQDAFAKQISQAGFTNVSYKNLNNGIVAIHSGWKI